MENFPQPATNAVSSQPHHQKCCIHYDTGEADFAWYYTLNSCSVSKPTMDWLVAKINLIPIQCDSINEALWLQFIPGIWEIDLLSAVWLVGETLAYSWARRKNKEIIDLQTLGKEEKQGNHRPSNSNCSASNKSLSFV